VSDTDIHDQTATEQVITRSVNINAPISQIWKALTEPELMKKWMSAAVTGIIADWQPGGDIIIYGLLHGMHFQNTGKVLTYKPERAFSYSHLNSLSMLEDVAENYSVISFDLAPADGGTSLTVTIHGFPTESIYKHLAFYWTVTIALLKKFIETEM